MAAQKGLVVITGASSGFGELAAREFSKLGHPLLLIARRLDRMQVCAGIDLSLHCPRKLTN